MPHIFGHFESFYYCVREFENELMIDNVEKEKQQKWATTRLKKKGKLTPEKQTAIQK